MEKPTYTQGMDTSYGEDNWKTPQTIDWQQAARAGVRFVYQKATQSNESRSWVDPVYMLHSRNSKGILLRGSYHFFTSYMSPKKQAQFYWDTIRDSQEELPPCLDLEGYPYGYLSTGIELQNQVRTFLDTLEGLCGRVPILYLNLDMIMNYLQVFSQPNSWIRRYPLWLAYPGVTPPAVKPWEKWTFWQYTMKGDAALYGISEARGVDLNYFNGGFKELELFAGVVQPEPVSLEEWAVELDQWARGMGYRGGRIG